ncbi:tetratricopeptide repeat protein [Amphritea balenae]|uniref:Uncharacterized protein n=1 Tax=Amphritea balenae TaxID=452629 RepID=A0A3P1SII4_9GAMM|nr:tetratricopeptide repeat protein [Amphritea balenae]RRC96958.1 hypothetical protein EHS89_19670 [Amphritea balenae]GGK85356.1 hypothetical protein GCM10007941_39800 [Amphritea balenae]
MKNMLKTGSALATAALLTGCISGNANLSPPVEDRSDGGRGPVVIDSDVTTGTAVTTPIATAQPFTVVTQEVAAPQPVSASNPAVVALLDSAKQQQQQGAYSSAQSSLERAQRIAPRDPNVYYQLADLRRDQGQYLQAEQLALKGLAVAGNQLAMKQKMWLLIADIRQEGGDIKGAKDARKRAY